jgi:translation elongation factor EF-G
MERALSILDYAIVIISGSEGVQSHTKTIWKLLERYHVPAFFFVNKMDMSHYSEEELLSSLHTLSDHIVKLDNHEEVAMCSESLLDSYLEKGKLSDEEITSAIASREVFPVLFGSALKNEKTVALLEMIDQYTKSPSYKDNLSGIVYKVSHDESGERLVHIRLTGGSLKPKDEINGEKINQVRIYQGANYTLSKDSHAGEVVTLTGIKNLEAGDVFGDERAQSHFLKPYLLYDIDLPEGEDQRRMLKHSSSLKFQYKLVFLMCHTNMFNEK